MDESIIILYVFIVFGTFLLITGFGLWRLVCGDQEHPQKSEQIRLERTSIKPQDYRPSKASVKLL